jgi:hypothetical protein
MAFKPIKEEVLSSVFECFSDMIPILIWVSKQLAKDAKSPDYYFSALMCLLAESLFTYGVKRFPEKEDIVFPLTA